MVQKPSDKLENKVDPAEVAEEKAKAEKTKIPKGAKVPQDHKSAKADVVDGDKGTVVEFEGKEYTAQRTAEEVGSDLDLMDMLSEGNIIPVLKSIYGLPQWNKFKKDFRDPETGITDSKYARELYETTMETFQLGNS